jgi:choline dehydrogenase-like flavoprotein
MLIESASAIGERSWRADVVIVGGGTLGLYLAVQLSRAGKTVLVAEGSGRMIETASNPLTARPIGKAHNGILHGRGQGLGGTSVLWGGQLAELDQADLARPGAAWPLSCSELHRCYQDTYARLGIASPPAAEPFGGDQLRGPGSEPSGAVVERFFTTWLPEPNFARLFKKELLTNDRIRVLLNTSVKAISFVGERALSVEAQCGGGRPLQLVGDDIVLACGTLAVNRLMLFMARQETTPWRHNTQVGRRFQDHLGGRAAGVRLLDEPGFRQLFENRFVNDIKLQPKLRWCGEDRNAGSVGVAGLFAFDSEVGENLSNLKGLVRSLRSGIEFSALRRLPVDLLRLGRILLPIARHYVRERRILALFDRGLDFHVQAEQIPLDRSRITLSDRGPLDDGLPAIDVDWQVDGGELAPLRLFVMDVDAALRSAGIAELDIDPRLRDLDTGFLDTLSDTYHACGGLCMSATAQTGVVDTDCRVWGTRNLYIAGSAVFPSSGHANSTFTALALATRLAGHLSRA